MEAISEQLKQGATCTISKRTYMLSAPGVTTAFHAAWSTCVPSTHKHSRVVLSGTIVLNSEDKETLRPFKHFPSEGCS